jgi:hypothetical protein
MLGSTGVTDLRALFHDLTGLDLQKDFGEFSTRLVFQKVMYLLQSAGAVRPVRSFGLHLYGPYSSDWAKQGFEVRAGKPARVTVTSNLSKVVPLIKNRPAPELVALATLHYYHDTLKLARSQAQYRAQRDGKNVVLQHFDSAWKELESHHWLT